jgi:hypothetical protein
VVSGWSVLLLLQSSQSGVPVGLHTLNIVSHGLSCLLVSFEWEDTKMATCSLVLAAMALWADGPIADSHHVLIFDSAEPPNFRSILKVLEIETGKVLAQVETGFRPDVTVSPDGRVVAALASYEGFNQLEFYQATDLKKIEFGQLPFPGRLLYGAVPTTPLIQMSPSATEIIVQLPAGFLNDEKPIQKTVDQTILRCVQRELDASGAFRPSRREVLIPRSRGLVFLRVTDWPRIQVWNGLLGAVEVIDLSRGQIANRVAVGDDAELAGRDLMELEKPNIGDVYFKLNAMRGDMVGGGESHAYYVPWKPGTLKRIDVASDPPRVVAHGAKQYEDLKADIAAASERAGAVFVAVRNQRGDGRLDRCQRIRAFRTSDLSQIAEAEVPLDGFDRLEMSKDGKYVYALDRKKARIAVIDAKTYQHVKTLDQVGTRPVMIIALPEPQ